MQVYSHIAKIAASPQHRSYVNDVSATSAQSVTMPRKASKKSANHLRAWREFREMTQDELAEKVGTAGNVISLLESGSRRLSDKWLDKLAPALQTRPGFLLEFDPHDADLSILKAITEMDPSRKPEALRLLQVFKTGTHD